MQTHQTVLLTEAVEALNVQPNGVYIDATLGSGGHTRAILEKLTEDNTLLSLDADQTALDTVTKTGFPATEARIILTHANFKDIVTVTEEQELTDIAGVLADLGWRMEQFSGSGKGFSFQVDEPLYMTYGDPESYSFTAIDVVNDWDEQDIANVLFGYGEERASRRIAKAIVTARRDAPIVSTMQLAQVIEQVIPRTGRAKIHPATKTFQALRIVVNDELSVLETFIDEAFSILRPGGRLAIITFHSLEDRIVKHRFRAIAADAAGLLVHKKPIVPTREEIINNPRARSAKLRTIEKT